VLSRDKNGSPLQVQDFNGNIARSTYNELNLVARIYDPAPFNANYIEKTYYRTGQLKTERNRRGHDTDYEYDELNRLTKVTDEP
jgi:YD repeat-containing protein